MRRVRDLVLGLMLVSLAGVSWGGFDGCFEGDCSNGKGKGKYTFANGDVYEGDFVGGHRTGKGKLTFANGDIYEGDFVFGQRTGKGKFTWPIGDVYEGDFMGNQMHGEGKVTFADGRLLVGVFENGNYLGAVDSEE